MYSRLQLAAKFLNFYLRAANGKGHGIHSPFVYDLVRNVLQDRTVFPPYAAIEDLRGRLLRDRTQLEVEDMGAGSVSGHSRIRTVGEIARHAAKPPRLGKLLFRLARYYRPSTVLELGTSLGLSTAYLAAGAKSARADGRVWTIEGAAAIADCAADNLTRLGLADIELLNGNFDEALAPLMQRIGRLDMAFVDGNHRCEPTLRYFDILLQHANQAAVLIFDDIHWSAGMEQAWEQIKADPRVLMTIDLFHFGLVIRRHEFKVKQDFAIRFW